MCELEIRWLRTHRRPKHKLHFLMFRLPVPPDFDAGIHPMRSRAIHARRVVQSNFDEIATGLTIDPADAARMREVIE